MTNLNLVESFEDEESARKALGHIVEVEPEAVEHVALLVHGDDWMPIGITLPAGRASQDDLAQALQPAA